MTPSNPQSCKACELDKQARENPEEIRKKKPQHQFTIPLDSGDSNFIITAEGLGKDVKLGFKYPTDLQFNLSAVLGNNNGNFEWGRTAFHVTGKDFAIEPDSGILRGQLLDLAGNYQSAHVHLREQIKVKKRYDAPSKDWHHFVTMVPLESNTNVVKLVDLLRKDDPQRQMVYYQTGVGTYGHPGLMTTAGLSLASTLDEAMAWYLYQHVIDGYKFLMQTYKGKPGDRIALFGFSRGAFTARALAGMLHSVGLLPAHNVEHVPFAYKVYEHGLEDKANRFRLPKWVRTEHPDPKLFKKTFGIPVVIDFVGVWDTVASVGALVTKELPYIDHNDSITTFRHALALDERRGNFIPSLWNHEKTKWEFQDVREVWFRGEHCDVGGGSAGLNENKPHHPDSMLSNISLRWMVQQIDDCKTGILFDHTTLQEYREKLILDMPPEAGVNTDQAGKKMTLVELDKADSDAKIVDSIGWRPLWHILEYFGLTHKATQVPSMFGRIAKRFPNAKAGRAIPGSADYPIYIHRSAIDRMEANGYRPRAEWYGYKGNAQPRIEPRMETAKAPGCPSQAGTQLFKNHLNLFAGEHTHPYRQFVYFCITILTLSALVAIIAASIFQVINSDSVTQVCRRVASLLWSRF